MSLFAFGFSIKPGMKTNPESLLGYNWLRHTTITDKCRKRYTLKYNVICWKFTLKGLDHYIVDSVWDTCRVFCVMFSTVPSSFWNQSTYTTLEYNMIINSIGMSPATKNHVELYAFGSQSGGGQYSMQKFFFLSKYIVRNRGMLRIPAPIQDAGMMIC